MGFFEGFIAFNINAFYEIIYFIMQNFFVLIALISIGYCFAAEEIEEHKSDIRDERQIL